jgi:hypothetical protein
VEGLYDDAIESTRLLRNAPSRHGLDIHRLRLELDIIEAIEERDGSEAADVAWRKLRARVSPKHDTAASALSWQRRAIVFHRRGDLGEMAEAILKAATWWSESTTLSGEASEAWFAWRMALQLSGEMVTEGQHEFALAASIRRRRHVDTEAARELETSGLSARTMGQFADSRTRLFEAYVLRRRRGQLFDVMRILHELGHVHEQAGEVASAIPLFIASGGEQQAERAARSASGSDVFEGLRLDGPAWERAATYAVLAMRGREAPQDFVERWAEKVLDEAAQPWFSVVSPQPALRARNALAALMCALPERLRERALTQLRHDALSGFIGASRDAANALWMSTVLGWSDETPLLADAVLTN